MAEATEKPEVRVLGAGNEWTDGSEQSVLAVLQRTADRGSDSDELAAQIRDWPTRYHLSRLRSKILNPLRVGPGMRVLDLGGGTGPISRRLGELGAEVLLLDGSAARAEAAAERCRDLDNVSVAVGTIHDLDDAEPFDLVLSVGVLEYAQASPDGPADLLRKAASMLAPDGAVAVAIENAIGLKYLLGYAEDHVGLPWVGWEGYAGIDHVRTWSRAELASLLAAAGLPEQAWFFPFPDYKLPTVIVSEAAYSQVGPEVVDSIVPRPCSPDASLPFLLADARAAHQTMLRAGLGPDVANSFLVVAGREAAALNAHVDRETLAWLPGSERRARFMRDRRLVSRDSALAVVDDNVPDTEVEDGWLLHRRAPETPFASGAPLDRLVAEALAASDASRTRELLTMWAQTLRDSATETEGADATPGPFQAVEGRLGLPGDFLDAQPANFVLGAGGLQRIDSEWEAAHPVDFDLIAVRGLFHLAVDLLRRGVSAGRMGGRDVAAVVAALADSAGLAGSRPALARLPEAEAALQALVTGVPYGRARAEFDRMLRSSAAELTPRAEGPVASPPRSELEAELDALREAHEAQSRALVAERLALAEEVEREVATLREEIEWRKEVMEQLEQIRNSRSIRYTEPLRRVARVLRRR